jgi:hypothetical protein
MKTTRHKLVIDYDYSFKVWGIVSALKDFKIAWLLNHNTFLELNRQPDVRSHSAKGGDFHIVNFKYETENTVVRLLKNKMSEEGQLHYIIPELKHLDYFLIIDSDDDTFQIENLYHCLTKITLLEYITRINLDELKSKENLLF